MEDDIIVNVLSTLNLENQGGHQADAVVQLHNNPADIELVINLYAV